MYVKYITDYIKYNNSLIDSKREYPVQSKVTFNIETFNFTTAKNNLVNMMNILKLNIDELSYVKNQSVCEFVKPINGQLFTSVYKFEKVTDTTFKINEDIITNTPPITSIDFIKNYETEIPINSLPNTLLYLDLGEFYNFKLLKNTLPNSLTTLKLSRFYRETIDDYVLPPNLEKLLLPQFFNQILTNYTFGHCTKLKYIEFHNGSTFNNRINRGGLPPALQCLKLEGFNRSISPDILPNTLEKLVLGIKYDRILIPNTLPIGIKYLSMPGYSYPIDSGVLHNLEHLSLGDYYNNPLTNLPNSLKYLALGFKFNQNISNLINLVELSLRSCDIPFENIDFKTLNSLKILHIERYPIRKIISPFIIKQGFPILDYLFIDCVMLHNLDKPSILFTENCITNDIKELVFGQKTLDTLTYYFRDPEKVLQISENNKIQEIKISTGNVRETLLKFFAPKNYLNSMFPGYKTLYINNIKYPHIYRGK